MMERIKPSDLQEKKQEKPEEKASPGNDYFAFTPARKFIHTGCSLLDCALGGGWVLGRIANIVGDKSVGKTLLAIEAAANFAKQYKGRIWYREAESAFDVPYAQSLGLPVKRVDFGPQGIDTLWDTIDEIFSDMEKCLAILNKENTEYHEEMDKLRPKLKKARDKGSPDAGLDRALEEAEQIMHPGLYIIDSLDALSSKDEIDRDRTKGTFGTQKAKVMSELFRNLVREFKYSSMSILFLSQIRDRIGATFGVQYERAGGKSLDFYASHVVYLSHIATLTRTINGVKRATAVKIRAKCTKNKISTPFRECQFPISFGYGIDELGASVEWLQEVKKLDALGIDLSPKPSKEEIDKKAHDYIKHCERMPDAEYQKRLVEVRAAVHQVWEEVEDGFRPSRSKYGN